MRIGLLDLDTSHPGSWVPIIRELGHEVSCVHDRGEIHPPEFARQFAAEHEIPKVCETPEEMIDLIDGVFIHTCNWDRHVALARPFVEAGRAVLIDKPIAGSDNDLDQFVAWAQRGDRIFGGSALRFCVEIREWLALPVEERGEIDTVVCGCGVDEFNYGIHAYALLAAIMGIDAVSVRHLGQSGQRRIEVSYSDGRCGLVVVGHTNWLPFHTTIVTDCKVKHLEIDTNRIYRALLEEALPYLADPTRDAPIPADELVQPERWALAAKRSWEQGNRRIMLCKPNSIRTNYDGVTFAETYRHLHYPDA